jgi:copper chaperone NosL
MQNKLSKNSKILLILSSIILFISIFVPLWRIELDAPQYPEGLVMKIFSYKLGGQVEIINGLNHYIGMQTLHAENFIEFTLLPYIISFFAILALVTAFWGNKKMLYFTFGLFLTFGIIAMADFWRWEYNYGHNLDPSAAIIVPGMAYQPPLIGFKQLLNFGAYSIPDIGGWFFIIAGLFMLISVLLEAGYLSKFFKKKTTVKTTLAIFSFILLLSCNNGEIDPIKLNKDKCDYCNMTISDGRFGAELITKKGRVYKFDDLRCLINYKAENTSVENIKYFVHDYTGSNQLIDAASAHYVKHNELRSPMGGNFAGFQKVEDAKNYALKHGLQVLTWEEILNKK